MPISANDNHIPSGTEAIRLKGKLSWGVAPDDIEARATNDAVYLCFGQDYGLVSISIYNDAGYIVYGTVVNTTTQRALVIPTAHLNGGVFVIELDSANGFAEGEFRKL